MGTSEALKEEIGHNLISLHLVTKIMDCKSETQTKTLEVRQLSPFPQLSCLVSPRRVCDPPKPVKYTCEKLAFQE